MTTSTEWAASHRRITRLCDGSNDARAIRLAVLDELRAVIGFDAYAWLLTDPETAVGWGPLADVPCLAELPRMIRLKYLSPINRWTAADAPSAATLRVATAGDPGQSEFWRELLSTYDVTDLASMAFKDRFGCWGFLDLWRCGPQAAFSDDEVGFLATIAAPITAALRRGQASRFVASVNGADPRPVGPVVLMLSPSLEVLGETPGTAQYLHLLVPHKRGASAIPSSAYNAAAQLLAVEAGIGTHSPSARMHLAEGIWVTVRAARLGGTRSQEIAVSIEESSPSERLAVFARASGLTARETELVTILAKGTDTRELAAKTYLSAYTVQDHLKSVFAKTGTRNRRTLLARALGT